LVSSPESGRGAGGSAALAERVCALSRSLARGVSRLRFGEPVRYVYNPLVYARGPHEAYLRRYATSRKRVLLLGMNPGPFGMAQTGVPFGAIEPVREWLGIEEPVRPPPHEHPKRPVQGFACRRNEVSGARLWGAIARRFETPERFFRRHFVANLVPLLFLEASGRNLTPDKLPVGEREALLAVCTRHLRRLVELLEPEWVVGVGAFAAERAREARLGAGVGIARILHPSPANPRAGSGWGRIALHELAEQGVCPGGALQ
jgi:single-strand selective monofunctional uracil DNA glycosylase